MKYNSHTQQLMTQQNSKDLNRNC